MSEARTMKGLSEGDRRKLIGELKSVSTETLRSFVQKPEPEVIRVLKKVFLRYVDIVPGDKEARHQIIREAILDLEQKEQGLERKPSEQREREREPGEQRERRPGERGELEMGKSRTVGGLSVEGREQLIRELMDAGLETLRSFLRESKPKPEVVGILKKVFLRYVDIIPGDKEARHRVIQDAIGELIS